MRMLGGSKGFSSLSNVVDFLADPKAAKAVLENHKWAIAEHAKAAEEHKQSEAKAQAALDALQAKQAELRDKEQVLLNKGHELVRYANELTSKQKELEEASKNLNKDRDFLDAQLANAKKSAESIIADAKAKADKILSDQQIIVKKMTDEALEKDRLATQSKIAWQQKLDTANKYMVEASAREAAVTKREQAIADLANKLKV
jgi:DNA repair exonuclease SbcCD ATPase subunit